MSSFFPPIQEILTKCELPIIKADAIDNFFQYILNANTELNLFSRKLTVDDILTDHIQDCLIGAKYFANYTEIADLGSGGGFPGLLLAIVFPEKQFQLYEKSVRKCEYLNQAKRDLHLSNVNINNNLVAQSKINSEVITCRAFKSTIEILDMTKAFFAKSGQYILYKGRLETINEELALASKKYKFDFSVEKLGDRQDKQRNMVLLSKSK